MLGLDAFLILTSFLSLLLSELLRTFTSSFWITPLPIYFLIIIIFILHWYWTNFTRNFINSYPCTWWSSTVTTWIGLLQSLTLFLSHAVRYHYRLFLSLHTPSDRGESRHMLPDPSIIKSVYFDLTSEMTSPNFYSTFLPWPCQFLLPLQSHCKVP